MEKLGEENYSKELTILYNTIREDLNKIDSSKTGKVSENKLLNFLKLKVPNNKNLKVSLFQDLFKDLEPGPEIDLNDFTKNYIQAHEEVKLNLETLKKGLDKEIKIMNDLKDKIKKVKNEPKNKNGMSIYSYVSTKIGEVNILSENTEYKTNFFCSVSLDNSNEQKTNIQKNINNLLTFNENFTFNIDTKDKVLTYKFFSASNNKLIGECEVPLFIINVNNEVISPRFYFKNLEQKDIALFKPEIVVVSSLFEFYNNQYYNAEKNIDSYKNKINELNQALLDISLPFKMEFDYLSIKVKKYTEEKEKNKQLINKENNLPSKIDKNKNLESSKDKIFIKQNNSSDSINDLKEQLNQEKINNKKLKEKIEVLLNNLKSERFKNEQLEEKYKKIKINFENKMKELEQVNKKYGNNIIDSKESLIKIILEKDKEINELKKKLSRYPFELNEGEKLITVNFISTDQKVQNYSIICKNTDIFNVIEKKLYEDYKNYYETENYFTFKGNKIHKYKSLDENKIKNNDIILLNVLDI